MKFLPDLFFLKRCIQSFTLLDLTKGLRDRRKPRTKPNAEEHVMMTDQQPAVPKPKYPLHACTTSELSKYRAELEHEIAEHSPTAAVVDDLRRLLADVLDEEADRESIRRAI